jgi:crotonobetainyl-CoA:carnitine CoA-transferase CaiB-like acyl-CoA transferase
MTAELMRSTSLTRLPHSNLGMFAMSNALAGVRVLDLAGGVAGGYCSKLLADLGADVILVEPSEGDACRRLGPFPEFGEPVRFASRPLRHPLRTGAPPPVPPVGGEDPERSGLFLYLHAGKRSVVGDLCSAEGRALVRRLVRDADVLLTAAQPGDLARAGLEPERLREEQPALVHVSITHFGVTGPYRDWQGDEITDYAMGGYLAFGGDPERGPLMVPGYQAQHHAGMQGAIAALAALAERDRSGLGQFVDISAVEAMLSAHSWTSVSWSHEGQVMGRTPTDLIRCADGWVFFMLTNLEGLAVLIERPDLLDDPRFSTPLNRLQHRQALHEIVAARCAGQTMEAIYRLGQELRVAVTPVATVRDLTESAQLHARDWLQSVDHPRAGEVRLPGAPYILTGTPARAAGPAPLLDEHGEQIRRDGWGGSSEGRASDSTTHRREAQPPTVAPATWSVPASPAALPLAGLRVIELTANWAGPLAGRYLADLGAEVIKVESPKRPATRGLHYAGGDGRTRPYNRSGYFNKLNRNKLGVALDLALPAGREVFLRLVERADVVIENNSARVLANLNLTYDVLRRAKPDIILCSMSGFGGTGPERDYVAYGSNIETVCGLASLMAYHDDPTPHRTGSYYADPVAGAHGAIAILAALRHRDRTGAGQWIDLSLLESAAALFGEALMDWSLYQRVPSPRGNRHPNHAPQGVYPSAGNDSWLALTVRGEAEWQALCAVLDRPDLAQDQDLRHAAGRRARHDLLDAAIGEWSRNLDHYEAARRLQAVGVPAAPVLANWELLSDPHLFARGFYVAVPHPEVGVLPFPGMPWRFSRTPAAVRGGAPCFAEHNALVFRDLLALSDAEIGDLYAQGVTADEPLVQLIR